MAFTFIPNADLLPGKPLSTDLMTQLRDNDEFLLAQTKGLVLVEKKIVTSTVSSVTFSGLDGDTDEVYKIVARIIKSSGIPGDYLLKPNGITSNQFSLGEENDAATIAILGTSTLLLARDITAGGLAGEVNFEATFWARKVVNAVAARRILYSRWQGPRLDSVGSVWSEWDETSVNVTSLVVAGPASEILNGSTIALYKMRQS